MEKINSPQFQSIINDRTIRLNNLFMAAGFELRLVGGAVRDSLIGITPKDIDFATDSTPAEMIDLLVSNDIYVVGVTDRLLKGESLASIALDDIPGIQHGTVTAVLNHEPFEITTLRVDVETDGRHAKTLFVRSFKDDAARRDLTFNSMSASLDGTLFDYFGGKDDLLNGRIRFVGDAERRICEDYLRILRYFRFAARYNLDFDAAADEAVRTNVNGLKQISGERIWLEMNKLLGYKNASTYVQRMNDLGVVQVIGMPLDMDAFVSAQMNTSDSLSRLASGMKNQDDVMRVVKHWKLSVDERKALSFYVANQNNPNFDLKFAKDLLTDGVDRALAVEVLKIRGLGASANSLETWDVPKFPVSGNDLMDRGYKPGKEMGTILTTMKNRWKDSNFAMTKDDLMEGV